MRTILTAIDAMEHIKATLESANIASQVGLTGEIRTLSRRLNSMKEDIVINTIVFTSEQVQEGFFNVNTHTPNLTGQVAGNPTMTDNTQPNLERMYEIGNAVVSALNEVWLFDSFFSIDNGAEPARDDKDWYINIKVRYYALRIDA